MTKALKMQTPDARDDISVLYNSKQEFSRRNQLCLETFILYVIVIIENTQNIYYTHVVTRNTEGRHRRKPVD